MLTPKDIQRIRDKRIERREHGAQEVQAAFILGVCALAGIVVIVAFLAGRLSA